MCSSIFERKEELNNVCVQAKSAKQRQKPSLGPTPLYPDLSMCLDWPQVEKSIVHLLITLKENSKLVSALGAQNKDLSAAWQTFLNRAKFEESSSY